MQSQKQKTDAVDLEHLQSMCEMRKAAFHRLWSQMIGSGLTHKTAYNKLEKLHQEFFGTRRFRNYNAFRKSRQYWIRNAKLLER